MHRCNWPMQLFVCIVAFLWISTSIADAQAYKTATRSDEFDLFGGFTHLDNNYLPPYTNYGVTFGGDYTHFIKRSRGLIVPSFQLRATIAPGSAAGEKTIEAGLKLATRYRRLHPYGDFMVGNGSITFPLPPNPFPGVRYLTRDNSFIYVYGGGLTYDVRSNWSAMVDYQYQYWNLGGHPPDRFYPQALTFGIVYRIPFKAYKSR